MTPITETNLIELDARGVAYITGSRIKVKHIAIDSLQGKTAAQLQASYPSLSSQQIASALSYFHCHRAEIEAEIALDEREAEALRSQIGRQVSRADLERRRTSSD
jgi:uncharacterized protein (DUF433 family)